MDKQRCNKPGCGEAPDPHKKVPAGGYYYDDLWFCGEPCLRKQVTQNLEICMKVPESRSDYIARPKMALFLLNAGAVTRPQLDQANQAMEKTGRGCLAGWLVKLGYTPEREITRALCRQLGLPFVDLKHAQVNKLALEMVPPPMIKSGRIFPLDYNTEKKEIFITFGAHVELAVTHILAKMLRCSVNSFIGDESHLIDLISKHCGITLRAYETSHPKLSSTAIPMKDLADQIIKGANQHKSNQLLFEAHNQLLWIRYSLPAGNKNFFLDMSQRGVIPNLSAG